MSRLWWPKMMPSISAFSRPDFFREQQTPASGPCSFFANIAWELMMCANECIRCGLIHISPLLINGSKRHVSSLGASAPTCGIGSSLNIGKSRLTYLNCMVEMASTFCCRRLFVDVVSIASLVLLSKVYFMADSSTVLKT